MSMVRSGLLVFALTGALAAAQDSAPSISPTDPATAPATVSSVPAQPQSAPPAATLNDVVDRVVQREHYFMAQIRHLHPLVETYLQDLKNDSDEHAVPIRDQYFLGRLDMSDGPEDISFTG